MNLNNDHKNQRREAPSIGNLTTNENVFGYPPLMRFYNLDYGFYNNNDCCGGKIN